MESEYLMTPRRYISAILFFCLVRPSVFLAAESCKNTFIRLGGSVLKSATLVGGLAFGMTAGSEVIGNLQGTPHIGLSIYLDYENVLSYLSSHERAEFQRKKKNPHAISDILIEHLSRQNHDSVELVPYLRPVMASKFFEESEELSNLPNMCRHKSLVMKAILNRLGIEAQLMTGTILSDSGRGEHVWLYLPSINKMADPMNRMLIDPEEYQKRFDPHLHFNVVQWAKPMGILGR